MNYVAMPAWLLDDYDIVLQAEGLLAEESRNGR
mgnify:CR=1 FL=1